MLETLKFFAICRHRWPECSWHNLPEIISKNFATQNDLKRCSYRRPTYKRLSDGKQLINAFFKRGGINSKFFSVWEIVRKNASNWIYFQLWHIKTDQLIFLGSTERWWSLKITQWWSTKCYLVTGSKFRIFQSPFWSSSHGKNSHFSWTFRHHLL